MVSGSDAIFDISVVDFIDVIRYNEGDEVTLEYKEGEQMNTVLSLNGTEKAENTEDTDDVNASNESDMTEEMH